jgi:hypothetical protein
VVVTISSAGLTDGSISANAAIIAAALLSHPLASQLGGGTVEVLVAIAERTPPTADAAERQFLRDAIMMVERAEAVISTEAST